MEQTDHIHFNRMLELSRMRTIIEEPEWKHMKDCEECLSEFARIVNEKYHQMRSSGE